MGILKGKFFGIIRLYIDFHVNTHSFYYEAKIKKSLAHISTSINQSVCQYNFGIKKFSVALTLKWTKGFSLYPNSNSATKHNLYE